MLTIKNKLNNLMINNYNNKYCQFNIKKIN